MPCDDTENAIIQALAILEVTEEALDGHDVSDFMESFPIVRKAVDLRTELEYSRVMLMPSHVHVQPRLGQPDEGWYVTEDELERLREFERVILAWRDWDNEGQHPGRSSAPVVAMINAVDKAIKLRDQITALQAELKRLQNLMPTYEDLRHREDCDCACIDNYTQRVRAESKKQI